MTFRLAGDVLELNISNGHSPPPHGALRKELKCLVLSSDQPEGKLVPKHPCPQKPPPRMQKATAEKLLRDTVFPPRSLIDSNCSSLSMSQFSLI